MRSLQRYCRWRREHSPTTPNTQEEIDVDNRFTSLPHCLESKLNCSRLCLDSEGNTLVVGDWQYPGDPNGRCLLFSSHQILQWLGERHQAGLRTVSRIGVDATFKVLGKVLFKCTKTVFEYL